LIIFVLLFVRLNGARTFYELPAHGATAATNGQSYQFSREAQITIGGKMQFSFCRHGGYGAP
jgi:hypothetical protein